MKGRSAYTLLQECESVFNRVENLALKTKGISKKAESAIDEAAGKLAEAMDELKKEVDRRRILKERYARDLRSGR